MTHPYYLSTGTPGEFVPALTLGQGYPAHVDVKIGDEPRKVPVAYLWKDAIAAGDYVHPATRQRLSVDGKRIDGWVAKFHAMRKEGIEIPTPVDHKAGAANNLGFVVDARRNGDRLQLLHQVIGEDAAMTAIRNRCSLCIDPDYTDERGRRWGDAFTHNAYTPNPVVSGMGQFVPFLASRDGAGETPVYYLSAGLEVPEMDTTQLRQALKVAADVPDDKLIEHVASLVSGKAAADARVTELTGTVATLSRTPAAPDPEMLKGYGELKVGEINLAVAAGDMPAVIATELKARVVRDGKPDVFMLSRNDVLDARPIDFVLGLFKGKGLGGPKTGADENFVHLSRVVPGGDGAGAAKTPEQVAAEDRAVRENLSRTELGRRALAEMDKRK